jgi:hypothetical protein
MEDFTKVVRIGSVEDGRPHSVFCEIRYQGGNLSISGVEGPLGNGDAIGACGQLDLLQISFSSYAKGWSAELVQRFSDVWKKWHLNDMRPGCEHQVGPEWTARDVVAEIWTLKIDVILRQGKIKRKLESVAIKSGTVELDDEERLILSLPYSVTVFAGASCGERHQGIEADYRFQKREIKNTGWLTEAEHSDGFLSKRCPVCGYRYGSAWLKVEVPEEVLQFLKGLPDADREPAWV